MQNTYDESNEPIIKPNRNDTMRLTQEFNEKHFIELTQLEITNYSVMIDDIRNFRTLTKIQLMKLESLTEKEKINIIHLYNDIFSILGNILNN